MAILLVAAVSGAISAPAASLAAPLPTLSISNASITEGDAGTQTLTFTVTQSARGKSSVRFATEAGTASSPSDYLARSGTLKF
ncbi:MAG TPA: hypothetical protein VJY85_05455, partial [Candidatus Limnocylindria bacterium]|nr:hypothetical protein [Candidatus Limnocylindria bacterium]